jgi:hypothetical protein
MQSLSFVVLALLPPLVSGPLPAMIWLWSGRNQNWRLLLPVAAFLTILLNLAASILIVTNLEGFLPSGFFACAVTPIVGLVTLLLSRVLVRRAFQTLPEDDPRRRWLKVGVFAVPVVQLFAVITLVLIAPALCNTGMRSCAE